MPAETFTSRTAVTAEAVKAELNARFDGTFVAIRKYAPAAAVGDLKSVTVTVFARGQDRDFKTRKHSQRDYVIDVGVQKKLQTAADPSTDAANAEIDGLIGLAEAIADHFPPGWTAPASGAQLVQVAHDPVVDRVHLLQLRTFTNVVTLTFRLIA